MVLLSMFHERLCHNVCSTIDSQKNGLGIKAVYVSLQEGLMHPRGDVAFPC